MLETLRKWLGLREIYKLDKGIFWRYILCLFVAFNFLIMGINKLFFWNLKSEEVPYNDALIVVLCLGLLLIFIILLLKFGFTQEFKEKYGNFTSIFATFILYSSMLLAFLIFMLLILKITQGKPLYIFKNYAVWVAVAAGVSPYVIRFANWKNQKQENYNFNYDKYWTRSLIAITFLLFIPLLGNVTIESYDGFLSNSGDGFTLLSLGLIFSNWILGQRDQLLSYAKSKKNS